MKRQLSYQFDLDIQRVYLLINMKCDVQVWWKSGKGKIATKNSIKLTGIQKYFDIREKLSIIAKIVMQNGIIREKRTQLLIILFTSQNTSKLGGRVNLNLAQFISPEALTTPVNRRFEKSLQNCPDQASKIIFNLSCKYIEENTGGIGGMENLNDISFQANNNFSSSFQNSQFTRSKADMTFRPEKQQQALKKQISNPLPQYNHQQGNRQLSPKEKSRGHSDRDFERQKFDTPSWDRYQRQKDPRESKPLEFQKELKDRQYQPSEFHNSNVSNRNRQFQRNQVLQPTQSIQSQGQPRPLEFSFNPTLADRQKMGIDNSEIVRDLKQIVQERGRTIKLLEDQLAQFRSQFQQKAQKSSSKSLALLNQLNTTVAQRQQLLKQKIQITRQFDIQKEQTRKLEQKLKSINFQYGQTNNQNLSKLQQRKRMIQELNSKLQQADRKVNRMQDQLFRKQNELITKDKQYHASQAMKQMINKQQTEKLKNISLSLKELQTNFEKVFVQKQDLKKKYEQTISKLQKFEEGSAEKYGKMEQQLFREKERYRMLEARFKERQGVINQIQNQFRLFSAEKIKQSKQREDELVSVKQKYNILLKTQQQQKLSQQSLRNTVSQKNIRIKTLQNICSQLQKSNQQKEQLVKKSKEYVSKKQQQFQSKILEREQFIQRCRTYVQNKNKQFDELIKQNQRLKNNRNDIDVGMLKKQIKEKQMMLGSYINEKNLLERKVEDMERVLDQAREKSLQYEEHIDQLQRKHESQEATLKDLVKKNLDMEIQLNIKDYEIQSLKKR